MRPPGASFSLVALPEARMSTAAPHVAAAVPHAGSPSYAVIRAAMLGRRQLRGRRQGRTVCFCPHALGWREGNAYVLGFMIQPDPTLPAAPGTWGRWLRLWQWLPLEEFDSVDSVEGPWFTMPHRQDPSLIFLHRVDGQAL